MVFSKKSHWSLIFLVVLSGKRIFFFFPKIFFRRKMKDDLSQKKYEEIWYFLQMPRTDGLSKTKLRRNMTFLVLSGNLVFYSRKIWCFFLGRKMIDDLAQEIHGNMTVSVYMYNCYNMILAFWYDITLFLWTPS